ncbi:MAG: universal stress protein [Candidatus Cybelea sp.]
MFKRITVALDQSDAAREAFAVALQLAKTERAELGVCSVIDPIVIAGTSPPSPGMDLVIRDMEVEARRLVNDAVERAHQAGIRASGQTRNGAPAFELLRYADGFAADLIVMGTHGRRGLKHFLLGSVAEVVLREASIPVLVVRSGVPSAVKQHGARDTECRDPVKSQPAEMLGSTLSNATSRGAT